MAKRKRFTNAGHYYRTTQRGGLPGRLRPEDRAPEIENSFMQDYRDVKNNLYEAIRKLDSQLDSQAGDIKRIKLSVRQTEGEQFGRVAPLIFLEGQGITVELKRSRRVKKTRCHYLLREAAQDLRKEGYNIWDEI